MSPEMIVLIGAIGYTLLMVLVGTQLFPRGRA